MKVLSKERLIDLLFLMTFGVATAQKVSSFKVPSWFLNQFEKSILNLFEGSLHILFIVIVISELIVSILSLASLIKNDEDIRFLYLKLSAIVFVSLGLGQRLTFKFDQAFSLFVYAGITIVFLFLLKRNNKNEY